MDVVRALSGGWTRCEGLGGRGRLFRSAIVVLEVALCFVLLVGCGLGVCSAASSNYAASIPDSIERIDNVQLLGGRPGVPGEQRAARQRELEDRLRAIPGVLGCHPPVRFPFPLAGDFTPIRWGLEDALTDNTEIPGGRLADRASGLFDTMRTPLVTGRTFTEADNDPTRRGLVVDTMLAAKAFPNQQAVGQRILVRIRTAEPEWVGIIGVVGHQRVTSLSDPGREQVYFAERFLGGGEGRPLGGAHGRRSPRRSPLRYARRLRRWMGSGSSTSCSR